jgi:hypothetical protein
LLSANKIRRSALGYNISINDNDTLKIFTPPIHDKMYWQFVTRPVKPGHTLVNFGDGLQPLETIRSSIGSPGDYSTAYTLFLIDQNNNLIPNLCLYKSSPMEIIPYTYTHRIIPSGKFECIAYGGVPALYAFCKDTTLSHPYERWNGIYRDSLTHMTDTLKFNITSIKANLTVYNKSIRFTYTTISSNKILLTIGSEASEGRATVQIYSLAGRIIKSIPIVLHTQSTQSLLIDNNVFHLPPGAYTAKLQIDNQIINTLNFKML